MTAAPEPEEDSSLAAMISAVAEGHPVTDLDRKILTLQLIRRNQAAKAPWSAIGKALGVSGQEAKRTARRLEREIKAELLRRALKDQGR